MNQLRLKLALMGSRPAGESAGLREDVLKTNVQVWLRSVGRVVCPGLRVRFAGVRDGVGCGRLRVAEAHAGGTTAGLVSGAGWRFGWGSAAASAAPAWKLLEPAVPRPICSPIRAPRRNYTCPEGLNGGLSKFWTSYGEEKTIA